MRERLDLRGIVAIADTLSEAMIWSGREVDRLGRAEGWDVESVEVQEVQRGFRVMIICTRFPLVDAVAAETVGVEGQEVMP